MLAQVFKRIILSLFFSLICLGKVVADQPLCSSILLIDHNLKAQVALLVEVQYKLSIGAYNHTPGLKEMMEADFKKSLSSLLRTSPQAYNYFKTEQSRFNKNQIDESQKRKQDKETKIEMESILTKLVNYEKSDQFTDKVLQIFRNLHPETRQTLNDLIHNNWMKASVDTLERQVAGRFQEILQEKVYEGNVQHIQELFDLGIFHINSRNESDFSILLMADYADQDAVIDWVLNNPEFDINRKNKQGFNDVEQLFILNQVDRAQYVLSKKPEIEVRYLRVFERQKNGEPFIDFVDIQPGVFRKGIQHKVSTEIKHSFSILSTHATQKMWKAVIDLSRTHLPQQQNQLTLTPHQFQGENLPVHSVSYKEISEWMTLLNNLSQLNNSQLQLKLSRIFPGHLKNDQYRIPTEAEWEYVVSRGGLSHGHYSHSNSHEKIEDYAWIWNNSNSGSKMNPVGQKKPFFFNEKPIYDVHGLAWEMLLETISHEPPQIVLRGSSFMNNNQSLLKDNRTLIDSIVSQSTFGYRIVRLRSNN